MCFERREEPVGSGIGWFLYLFIHKCLTSSVILQNLPILHIVLWSHFSHSPDALRQLPNPLTEPGLGLHCPGTPAPSWCDIHIQAFTWKTTFSSIWPVPNCWGIKGIFLFPFLSPKVFDNTMTSFFHNFICSWRNITIPDCLTIWSWPLAHLYNYPCHFLPWLASSDCSHL